MAAQLADWERQQETARAALHDDIATERARLMAQVQTTLEHERDRARVLEERHHAAFTAGLEHQAITVGAAFVSRLLQRFASPTLEARVIAMALEDLEALDAERVYS
jgi:F-type H+-transporting ATPase subunit b